MKSEIRITEASKGPFLPRAVTGERCVICAYYSCWDDSVFGLCKRHAPVIAGKSTHPIWPSVYECDWCGDFARVIKKGGDK